MNNEIKNKLKDIYESIKNDSEKNFVRELTNKREELDIDLETINKIRFSVSLRAINKNGKLS